MQVVELKHQTVFDRSAWEALSFEVRGPHRAFIFLVDTQVHSPSFNQPLSHSLLSHPVHLHCRQSINHTS